MSCRIAVAFRKVRSVRTERAYIITVLANWKLVEVFAHTYDNRR